MPAPKPDPKYPCSQAELYAICDIGWDSCDENLADFTGHKTFYDAAFVTARRGELSAAQALPDDQARGEAAEVFGIQMRQAADAALLKWRTLRSYINDSFPPELVKPKLESAGYLKYETASQGDWEDLRDMLISGATFITANTAELTTPGGMPAGFAAAYNTAATTFSDLYADFKDAEQDSEEGTGEKINANNDIFTKLMKMFDDGQVIYEGNAAKRDRFIFTKVKELVSSAPGGGGGGIPATSIILSGKVTDSVTSAPIQDVQINVLLPEEPGPVTTFTNASGDYTFQFNDLPAGAEADLTVNAIKAGYNNGNAVLHVVAGNSYTANFALVAV